MKIYVGCCRWRRLKENGKRCYFRKCHGNIFRIPCKMESRKFNKIFAFVDVCEKCDAVHQIWKKGELDESSRSI